MTLDLAALRKLSDAATPGPWKAEEIHAKATPSRIDGFIWPRERADDERQGLADIELIAAARNALPDLLDLVESQAAEIEQLERHRAFVAEMQSRIRSAAADIRGDPGRLMERKEATTALLAIFRAYGFAATSEAGE